MIKCDKCGENMIVDTRVVLTSIPPMYECYCPKCGNRKYAYCSECLENEKIDFDGYVGIGFNATKERCNAIPIEWIEKYAKRFIELENRNYFAYRGFSDTGKAILYMLEEWEKENETN